MPPYENESLHDMHALMQQLDTLNAGNTLDHLGAPKPGDGKDQQATAKKKTMMERAMEKVYGESLDGPALKQIFCEIASKIENWPPPVLQEVQKMITSNKNLKSCCPATKKWTLTEA
jgi:hypothetical protein